jgi:uncharacterized protein YkwD
MGNLGQRSLALTAALLCALGSSAVPTVGPGAADREAPEAGRSQVLGSSLSRTTATPTTPKWSGSVNTNDRAAVNSAYLTGFASGMNVPTGWAGSDSRCVAGTQAPGSRTATLRAINFARSMGGLAPVTFSTTLNARSQQTALIMSANRALSHQPPSSWRCWTSTGAANAGRSNLALSYPSITSAGLVSQYLEDAGSSNQAAGHRRWLLNPFTTQMGSGSTNTANAVTVMGPTSTSRPNPALVGWPTAGWFPDALEPSGRWSLSLGDRALSFRWATVRVWRNGTLLRVVKNPVVDGYAQPTVVWQMPTSLARSGTFKVEVSAIRRSATSTRYTRSYYVRMFTPGR